MTPSRSLWHTSYYMCLSWFQQVVVIGGFTTDYGTSSLWDLIQNSFFLNQVNSSQPRENMQANLVNTGEVELLVPQDHTVNKNMVQGIKLHTFRWIGASGQPHAPVAWFPLHSAREVRRPRPAESLSHLFLFHLAINSFLNIKMNRRLGCLPYVNIKKFVKEQQDAINAAINLEAI